MHSKELNMLGQLDHLSDRNGMFVVGEPLGPPRQHSVDRWTVGAKRSDSF